MGGFGGSNSYKDCVTNEIVFYIHLTDVAFMYSTPRLSSISNFAVTYRCNSRCSTCNIWSRDAGNELSLSEIRDFLSSNRKLLGSVTSVQLTGGEPFLRSDLCEIAKVFWGELPGCSIWVATNGLLPEVIEVETRRMLRCRKGPLGVTVSLDGVGATHDAQRGVVGGYDCTIRTIEILSKLRGEGEALSVSVGLTLTPLNLGEVGTVLAVVESFGADFTVRPMNVSAIYYGNEAKAATWDWVAVEGALDSVAKHYIRNRRYLRSLPVLAYLRGMLGYMLEPRPRSGCSAGSSSLFLAPNGDVYPCLMMGEKVGNVLETPFANIWSGDAALAARVKIATGRCPGCWVECETMREVRRDKLGLVLEYVRSLPLLLAQSGVCITDTFDDPKSTSLYSDPRKNSRAKQRPLSDSFDYN